MKKILVLFAHPAYHKSRINRRLIEVIQPIDGITVNNLYENYPDFFINIKREKELLLEHDIIVWHHPFYWYSAPAIIKEWMDLVLEHGFAYGHNGRALEGKKVMSVITTGGTREVYCEEGRNHYTINQFLVPFHQTANLCRMDYLPPFVVHGSHTMNEETAAVYAGEYKNLMIGLRDDSFSEKEIHSCEYINALIKRNA